MADMHISILGASNIQFTALKASRAYAYVSGFMLIRLSVAPMLASKAASDTDCAVE